MKDSPKLLGLIPGDLELRLAPPGEQWPPVVHASSSSSKLVTPQKRASSGPVVGWPPVRSFRKNKANSNASKNTADDVGSDGKESKAMETPSPERKSMFRKINMDGIPIGRKVDLGAYDSYEELAAAVDALFGALLAAQKNSAEEQGVAIKGLLDGSGDYNLVYEDNEGDRMLVGDVPWAMFVSTVKRLRVLKSCDISTLRACDPCKIVM